MLLSVKGDMAMFIGRMKTNTPLVLKHDNCIRHMTFGCWEFIVIKEVDLKCHIKILLMIFNQKDISSFTNLRFQVSGWSVNQIVESSERSWNLKERKCESSHGHAFSV